MVSKYGRANPPACFIVVAAVILVLGCYLMWNGALQWFRAAGSPSVAATRGALAQLSATPTRATLVFGPTRTPVPPCQEFEIWSADARVRDCPSLQCERRLLLYYQDKVCVYGRAEPDTDGEYPTAQEWYVIDLNPDGAFRDLAYIHESVVRPVNPTPRPSQTFTPLPTVTITPSYTPLPSSTPDNNTPTPTETPIPAPSLTPTIPRQQF